MQRLDFGSGKLEREGYLETSSSRSGYSPRVTPNQHETMLDTVEIKREIESLSNRLGQTQDYL